MTTKRTIFVFGSNRQGRHGGGAARHALDHCGAKWGQSQGLQGDSYAIITKELRSNYPPVTVEEVGAGVDEFLTFARRHPDMEFEVAAIGCRLAGFKPEQIAPLFVDVPTNVRLPQEFKDVMRTRRELKVVTWLDHVEKWRNCDKCDLCHQRSNIVLARGVVPCDVLFIGEAPGDVEDGIGLPFKGPAGAILDQMIECAVPPDVTYALTNLVACYPRERKLHKLITGEGDNEPEHKEILACRPRLREFVEIAQPRLIVTVGTLAEGYVEDFGGHRVHIIHPAATFPPRMARAQAQFAIDRAIVKLRCAVEEMLQC